VARAAKGFIEAEEDTTRQEKAAAASHFMQTIESLPSWQALYWGSIGLPHFMLPGERDYKRALKEAKASGEEVVFPWHELAEAANSDNQIARALLCLGTWDDRIHHKAGIDDLTWMAAHLEIANRESINLKNIYEATVSTPRDPERQASRFQLISDGAGIIVKLDPLGYDPTTVKSVFAKRLSVALEQTRIGEQARPAVTNSTEQAPSPTKREGALSFQDLPYPEFMREPYSHLKANEGEICPASYIPGGQPTAELKTEVRQLALQTAKAAANLLDYFDGMLRVTTEPERSSYRAFIKEFFLDATTPLNFGIIDARQREALGSFRALSFAYWVANDTHQIFSLSEKGSVLSASSDGPVLMLARKATGLEKPVTIDQLQKAIDSYLEMDNKGEAMFAALHLFGREAISLEVHEFLRDHGKDAELHRLLSSHGNWLERVHRESAFEKYFVDYLKRETSWPTDAKTLGTIYRAMQELSIFPDQGWRAAFANRVLESFDATTDSTERIDALENLLFGGDLSMDKVGSRDTWAGPYLRLEHT
jgi:hypothetical protein